MLLYWVAGLDEADPVLYGVPADQVSAWGATKVEFIAAKRRELYRVQKAAEHANAKSEAQGAALMFWVLLILALISALLGLTLHDNNPRTEGDPLFFLLTFVFGIFTAIVGVWWASAQSALKKFQ